MGKNSNSVKHVCEITVFSSAHCLIMVQNCTKFHENILNGIKVMERTRFFSDDC